MGLKSARLCFSFKYNGLGDEPRENGAVWGTPAAHIHTRREASFKLLFHLDSWASTLLCIWKMLHEQYAGGWWCTADGRLFVKPSHLHLAELTPFWWCCRKALRTIPPCSSRASPSQHDSLTPDCQAASAAAQRQLNLWQQHTLRFNASLQSMASRRTQLAFSPHKSYQQCTGSFLNNSDQLGKGKKSNMIHFFLNTAYRTRPIYLWIHWWIKKNLICFLICTWMQFQPKSVKTKLIQDHISDEHQSVSHFLFLANQKSAR